MREILRSQDAQIKNMRIQKDNNNNYRDIKNRSPRLPGSLPYENRRIMLRLNGIMAKKPNDDHDGQLSKSPSKVSL